jgi:YopJ family protease
MSTPPLSQIANLSSSSTQHTNDDKKIKQNFSNSSSVVPCDVTPAIPRAIQCKDTNRSNNGSYFRNVSIHDFKNSLKTKEGLEKHVNLLQSLYDEGIDFGWKNAIKTDIILLPKLLWVTCEKYPNINLTVLTSGIEQIDGKIIALAKNNVQSAKIIVGTNGLDTEANHFLMADYYLDISSKIKTASVIFFDPAGNEPEIKSLIDDTISKLLSLRDTLKIKYLYVPLDIQKSTIDCLMFSLEIAKASHKSVAEMQQFHQLNINDQIETDQIKQLHNFNIATQHNFDQYIATRIMKHCQSYTRIESYNNKPKIYTCDIAKPFNKGKESIVDRYQKYTKNKYFNDKLTSKKTSFSIEKKRIRFLEKILQHWEKISGS